MCAPGLGCVRLRLGCCQEATGPTRISVSSCRGIFLQQSTLPTPRMGVMLAVLLAQTFSRTVPSDLTVDEEGVMHRRGPVPDSDFDLSKLTAVHEGTHDQQEIGSSYRIFYEYDGNRISPWHRIPLRASGYTDNHKIYHFLCEIPKGTSAKFEVHKSFDLNPVAQDIKKNQLRFYRYSNSTINYGAIMQTWEDPEVIHPDTNAGGDNDPIDVLQVWQPYDSFSGVSAPYLPVSLVQINPTPCELGEVMPVRILGTLALVDGGETDWKLIVVDDRDPSTTQINEIEDVPVEKVSEMREWFRNYKTAEGKGQNRFGLDERAMPRKYQTESTLQDRDSHFN